MREKEIKFIKNYIADCNEKIKNIQNKADSVGFIFKMDIPSESFIFHVESFSQGQLDILRFKTCYYKLVELFREFRSLYSTIKDEEVLSLTADWSFDTEELLEKIITLFYSINAYLNVIDQLKDVRPVGELNEVVSKIFYDVLFYYKKDDIKSVNSILERIDPSIQENIFNLLEEWKRKS